MKQKLSPETIKKLKQQREKKVVDKKIIKK